MIIDRNAYPKLHKMRKERKSLEQALTSSDFIEANRRVEHRSAKKADREKSTRPANQKRLDRMKETIQAFSGKSQYDLDESHKWSGEKIRAYLMLMCVKYGIDTDLSKQNKSRTFSIKQVRDFVDALSGHFSLSRRETLLAIEQWFSSWENFCEVYPKARQVGFYPGYWIKALGSLARYYPFNVVHQAKDTPTATEEPKSISFDSMKLSNFLKKKDSPEA